MNRSSTWSSLQRLSTHADHHLKHNTDIHVLDIEKGPESLQTHVHCTSHGRLVEVIDDVDRQAQLRVRVISLHCPWTVLPLVVTKDDLLHIFRAYQIDALFADVVTAFGSPPNPEDGGSAPAVAVVSGTPGREGFECWYRLQYFERNNRSQVDPWSPRHTVVYQKYSQVDDFSLILLLHPSDESVLEQKLLHPDSTLEGNDTMRILADSVFGIHVMICDMYLHNWRDHLRDHGNKVRTLRGDIGNIELTRRQSNIDDMSTIRELHHLHNVFSRSAIFCQGNSNILRKLRHICSTDRPWSQSQRDEVWLATMEERALDHAAGYKLLNDQVEDAIEHLQYAVAHQNQALTVENQKTATELNETLLQLTYKTADDSASIRVITILGLIYLPGSFVATLFGMDFFDYKDNDGLVVGHNIWIFVLFWLFFTIVTVSIYLFFVWKRSKQKKTRKLVISDDVPLDDIV